MPSTMPIPDVARPSAGGHRGCVAPLSVADVERVADLHGRAFGAGRSRAALTDFLTQIFFEHPWRDDSLPSLGYFDRGGVLVGCLGVMPRPMMFRDQAIRAVVTHNFMVDAANRGGLAAIQLMRSLMDRGPDLVLADGNAAARRICEGIGGRVVEERSARWLRVLRPAGLGVHFLSERLAPSIGRSMRAVAALPDAIATRVARMNVGGRPLEGADSEMWGGASP